MSLRYTWLGLIVAFSVGCATEGEPAPVQGSVSNTLKAAQAKPKTPAAPTGLQARKKPTTPTDFKVTSRPKPPAYKWGCNYNTSCKLNCEWCGVNGTCTCRLKGID